MLTICSGHANIYMPKLFLPTDSLFCINWTVNSAITQTIGQYPTFFFDYNLFFILTTIFLRKHNTCDGGQINDHN